MTQIEGSMSMLVYVVYMISVGVGKILHVLQVNSPRQGQLGYSLEGCVLDQDFVNELLDFPVLDGCNH